PIAITFLQDHRNRDSRPVSCTVTLAEEFPRVSNSYSIWASIDWEARWRLTEKARFQGLLSSCRAYNSIVGLKEARPGTRERARRSESKRERMHGSSLMNTSAIQRLMALCGR